MALGEKAGQQEPAGHLVERRVRRDGRGEADGGRDPGLEVVHDHAVGAEVLGVVGDGGHVLVAGRAATSRRSGRSAPPGSARAGRPRSRGALCGVGRRSVWSKSVAQSVTAESAGGCRIVIPAPPPGSLHSDGTVPEPAARHACRRGRPCVTPPATSAGRPPSPSEGGLAARSRMPSSIRRVMNRVTRSMGRASDPSDRGADAGSGVGPAGRRAGSGPARRAPREGPHRVPRRVSSGSSRRTRARGGSSSATGRPNPSACPSSPGGSS